MAKLLILNPNFNILSKPSLQCFGHLLAGSSEAEVAFQLVSEEGGDNFTPAVGSNTGDIVPVYRFVVGKLGKVCPTGQTCSFTGTFK